MLATTIDKVQLEHLTQLFSKTEPNYTHTATASSLPLEYVEFELKHAKEYMTKLKFNLLELTSKRVFLDKLMPSGQRHEYDTLTQSSMYDEWTNCQTRWTPGDLKDLERQVEAKKSELKSVKEAIISIKDEIAIMADHVVSLRASLDTDRHNGLDKITKISALQDEIAHFQVELQELVDRARLMTEPAGNGLVRCGSCEDSGSIVGEVWGIRSVEELKGELDELSVQSERKGVAIQSHRNNITEMTRIYQHHSEDLLKLQAEESRLLSLLEVKQKQRDENAEAALEQLCVWYRSAIEAVGDITRMKFEMIRPDYILITFKPIHLTIHLTVDPQTGRLLAAQVGSTATSAPTQKNEWKELCDQAVDCNDICTLLHSIQQKNI